MKDIYVWHAQDAREHMPVYIKEQEELAWDLNYIQNLIEAAVAANQDTIEVLLPTLHESAYDTVCGYLKSHGYRLARVIRNDNDTLIISWRE